MLCSRFLAWAGQSLRDPESINTATVFTNTAAAWPHLTISYHSALIKTTFKHLNLTVLQISLFLSEEHKPKQWSSSSICLRLCKMHSMWLKNKDLAIQAQINHKNTFTSSIIRGINHLRNGAECAVLNISDFRLITKPLQKCLRMKNR